MDHITENESLDNSYVVPGLERGLRILAEFSPAEPALSSAELSNRLCIPRTTVFRLLQTLEALGFIERTENERYFRLSVAVLRLGFEYLSSLELTDFGNPILERLRDSTGFSSHIVIRDGRDIVFIAKAQRIEAGFASFRAKVGTRMPAHATIHGRFLLGDLSLSELLLLYPERQLERFTERTPCTVMELYELIQADLERGFAVSESSFERDISVITAPVRDETSKIVAVVTLTIPGINCANDMVQKLVDLVLGAAEELSIRLNYRPPVNVQRPGLIKLIGLPAR